MTERNRTEANRPPTPEDRSPPELDEAILKASRREARFHWLTTLLERVHLAPSSPWHLLVALAIGLLLGLGLNPLIGSVLQPERGPFMQAGDPLVNGVPPRKKDQRTSPESWLKSIAALVLQGKTAEAESALRTFRQRYPDYRLPPRP